MAGAVSVPNARLLFATIDATTLSTADIGAIAVVVSTTIAGWQLLPPLLRSVESLS